MQQGQITQLPRRGVVTVRGADAVRFLNDLLTSDVPEAVGDARFGALLSPQGKILFDFIALHGADGFLFDLPAAAAADFARRLTFYRLRAKADIADESATRSVVVAWNGTAPPQLDGVAAPDPRLAALGYRVIVPRGLIEVAGYADAAPEDYDNHRITLGIPEGGLDFAYGDAYPHDADMDQLRGIDFKKGCYVGQEIVSRMQHRGTARRRFVLARSDAALPPAGTPVNAGEVPIGAMGSSSGSTGLALVRLDRARAAKDAGTAIVAGTAALTLMLPAWAEFGWPVDTATGG